MNHFQLGLLRSAGSKFQFLIQAVDDESEMTQLEKIARQIDIILSSSPAPKIKPYIESYSPGHPTHCPKCNSDKVVIFFDPRFVPRFRGEWKELIRNKKTALENRWEKIKTENRWWKMDEKSAKPNWICKDCYEGGVVLENMNKSYCTGNSELADARKQTKEKRCEQ